MTALRAGAATDTGLVRTSNQDTYLLADPLFAVADGMGGHAAGEVASATAVQALGAAWRAAGDRSPAALARAAEAANHAVWDSAQADPALRGMGTTLVAVALVDGAAGSGTDAELAVVNVGDSRVYRLRTGELEQLTNDHSLVAEMVAAGQLAAEEAEFHPQRHVLTRALGVDPEVPVDLLTVEPSRGDRLLLCSDGLIREVSDGRVASILRRLSDPAEAARELVSEARLSGGSDNITVVVVDVVDDGDRAARASAAVPVVDEGAPAGPTGAVTTRTVPTVPRDDTVAVAAVAAPATPAPPPPVPPPPARRRQGVLTVRVIAFAIALLAVLAAAAAGVGLYARGTYYVGVDRGTLAVYKGRPGGVLWFAPTLTERTSTPLSAVAPYLRQTVQGGVLEPNQAAADAYLRTLTRPASTP